MANKKRASFGMAFIVLSTVFFIVGCNDGAKSVDSSQTKPNSKKEECHEPQNPYNDGGGHDAGFNWASENGGECNGNSDSFNEGCAEFFSQLNRYNECFARNRK